MKCIGVIPARLASTRLPEKVLRLIAGKPMIRHVWEQVSKASEIDQIIIACDHARILECVKGFGGEAIMTRADHPNGSSRVSEIAEKSEGEIFINIQGDEPLIDPQAIDALAKSLKEDSDLKVATLAVQSQNKTEYHDSNTVKVVCDTFENALYFSRSPIPHDRDESDGVRFLKHLGIYGYRKNFLEEFINWDHGYLEQTEKLEQLRILERGIKIRVVKTNKDSPSVDTEEDLKQVEALIKQKSKV